MLQKLSGNVSPAAPNTRTAPPPASIKVTTVSPTESVEFEFSLVEFTEKAPAQVDTYEEASQDARKVNFEKLSSHTINEVQKIPRLKHITAIIIQIGDQTIKIPSDRLNKGHLLEELQKHFSHLNPEAVSYMKQTHAEFSPLIREISGQKPAAGAGEAKKPVASSPQALTSPQLKHWEKEVTQKIPAKIREKYGLTDEVLSKWKETGKVPENLAKLFQDYGKEHQEFFQPLLILVAFGKAVNEARAKAGLLPADQLKEVQKPLDQLQSEASKKWETLNATAVKDSRKVADQSYQNWKKADQQLTDLQKSLAGRTNLSLAEQKQLATAQANAKALLDKQQKAQKVALTTAHTMKDVRLTRVEVFGGPNAPLGMREKAAGAVLDAATTEIQAAKHTVGVEKRDPKVAESIPNNIANSLNLLEQMEQVLPEWRGNQAIISQRTGVLEEQQAFLKPFMQTMQTQKQIETQREHILRQLKELPPEGAELPEHAAKRKALLEQLDKLSDLPGDKQTPDRAGGKLRPGEVWAAKMNAKSVGMLQRTYQADINLNNVEHATPAQKQRVELAAGKSRDLYLASAAQGHDAQDAQLDLGTLKEETKQWEAFGKADAQARIDAAAKALHAVPEKPSAEHDAQRKLAEDELAAAVQFKRNQEARFARVSATPSGALAELNAQLMADNLGIPVAGLAFQAEEQAVKQHSVVGAMYAPGDPHWLEMNGSFITQRTELDQRTYDRSRKFLDYLKLQDQGGERIHAQQAERLRAVNKELADLPAIKSLAPHEREKRKKLEAEQASLRKSMAEFEESPAGKWGVDLAHINRQSVALVGPNAELKARQAEQKNNVELAQAFIKQGDDFKTPKTPTEIKRYQQAIQATLSAAEMPSGDSPGVSAKYLRDVNAMVAKLPPAERQAAQEEVKQRALEIYKSYIASPHQTAFGQTDELAKAVDDAINPGGQVVATDKIQKDWQALRAQSDPSQAFLYHRQELEAALKILQTQVSGDIEAQFNLAVEKGGFAVGTAARLARSQMMAGDIDAAKATLAKAVQKALVESQQAEEQYKKLPPSKQEQYRNILRSEASTADKQEALEGVFGNSGNAEAAKRAAMALKVSSSSQTMIRANAAGSDYDYTHNAQQTAELMKDRTSGVRARGGQEAEAIASRASAQRQRDEKYWNDPAIAILSNITDEALMFVVTMGMSTAFSLAKGAVTGVNAVKTAYEAGRVGKLLIRSEELIAKYNLVAKGLAKADGWLLSAGRLGRAGSMGLQFTRGMARNIAIEQGFKGVGHVAEKIGGKDTWLTWAAEASSKLFGTQVNEIKGLDSLQNSLWNISEPLINQTILPLIYKDPRELQQAQDVFHYVMMGLQTVHGMHQMHAQGKFVGELDALSINHDLSKKMGKELDPKVQERIKAEVVKYQEALVQNQGVVTAEHHQALLKGIEATIPSTDVDLRARVRDAMGEYLKPHQMQVASRTAGLDSLNSHTATPAKMADTVKALEAALMANKVTDSPTEAHQMAVGQVTAHVLQQSVEKQLGKNIDWSQTSPEHQAKLLQHLEQTAHQLQQLGLVKDPVTALSVVKADMLAHMKNQVAQAQSTHEKVNLDALNQNFALIEQHSQLKAFSQAVVKTGDFDAAHQAKIQSALEGVLKSDSTVPLHERVQSALEKVMTEAGVDAKVAGPKAKELALVTCQKWAEQAVLKMQISGQHPQAKGLDWFDQHHAILKSLGVEPAQAQQMALDHHLNQMAEDLKTIVPADQADAVKTKLLEVFAKLQADPTTDPKKLNALQDELIEQLKALKIEPDKATILSKIMLQESALLVHHIKGEAAPVKAADKVETVVPVAPPASKPKAEPPKQPMPAYPDAKQLQDPEFMMAYYEHMGSWDQIRQLEGKVPAEVFNKLHEIRDKKVQAVWDHIKKTAEGMGIELHYPYVGRGPDKAGYTGAYADLDLVVRIKEVKDSHGQPVKLSMAQTALKELQLKRLLQEQLGTLSPATGLMLDVNAYITPHFPEIVQGGQQVPQKLLEDNHLNELHMDFYQMRQGFGEHGHAEWKAFQEQALKTAQKADAKAREKGQPAHAEAQLIEGFKWSEQNYNAYLKSVTDHMQALRSDPKNAHKSDAMLREEAATHIRNTKEDQLSQFLKDHADVLELPNLEGAQARVQYNQLQMELRSISPEAYAGNAAVQWGSRGGAEQKQFLDSLASNGYAGLQGRISQAQYILHYVHDTSLPVEQRAWKAGKYDLRDAIFLDAVNAKGSIMKEVTNPAYTWLMEQKKKDPNFKADNESSITPTIKVPEHETTIIEMADNSAHYVPVKENKAHNPLDPNSGPAQLPLKPDDDPRLEVPNNEIAKRKQIPVNKMDQAALDARVNAKSPEQALNIWVKYFGDKGATKAENEAKARKVMGEYLQMLGDTMQDTSARHLMRK